ncbi:mitochondrial mRNA pseudouridine synthase RPUSD3-like isoform X2 [Anneissia japonica]|uniref:mitochondrial mRNA pseudouridine synthase RPUSD3-like isoform X2 n=1 Tax=Anneissia japonica TaxID=1529436 RepID=UPI001425709B|nr:mitochondrial mRNA pseudouridine synthase RPUSD3-like isoform X2 [Anneissia japonica]
MTFPQLLTKFSCASVVDCQWRRLLSSLCFSMAGNEDTAPSANKKNIFSKSGVLDVSEIDRDMLIKVLVNSVAYEKDGILALSKPAGLPVSGKRVDGQLSLMDVWGDVADGVNRPNAVLISAPEKESSGIVLLADDNITANKLSRDIADAGKRSQVKRQYIALIVGIPEHHQGSQNLNLGQEIIGEELRTVIKHEATKGSIKRQETKNTNVDYNVLDYNVKLNSALIEMWPLKAYKHQLQVHTTSMLCSILGDHLYSNRVQSVLGTPVLIDPNEARTGPQKLPKMLRNAMNLSVSRVPKLPLHLHYNQLFLRRPDGDVHVTAPHPTYFKRSMKLLDLEMPT